MITLATVSSYIAAGALLAAVACGLGRKWGLAALGAGLAALVSLAALILLVGRFVVAANGESKATALSLGVSELLNCSVIPAVVTIAAVSFGRFARGRLRGPQN